MNFESIHNKFQKLSFFSTNDEEEKKGDFASFIKGARIWDPEKYEKSKKKKKMPPKRKHKGGTQPKPKKQKPDQGAKNFYFGARWSIPKDQEANWAVAQVKPLIHLLKSMTADKYTLQLEDSHMGKTEAEINAIYAEKGLSVPVHNLHMQIHFHTVKRQRDSTLHKIANDNPMFKGMWIKPASTAGRAELKSYCMKVDTRIAGPWSDRKIYQGEDLITPEQFTDFQKKVTKLVLTMSPGNRASYWFFCKDGGSGKSAIAKYLAYHHGIPMFTYAKAADILFLASIFQGSKAYIVNLSKSKPADVSENDLYNALEALKDGHFTSTKYKPVIVTQGRAHVIVFANHPPSLEAMTRKRFIVKRLKPLPLAQIEDEDLFENCEGVENMTEEDVAKALVEAQIETAKQSQKLAQAMSDAANEINVGFIVPMEQEGM